MTLKHDNQAAFTLSHPNSPDVTYTDVRFEICQPGYGDWQAIAGNRWTARIAGSFNVRALAFLWDAEARGIIRARLSRKSVSQRLTAIAAAKPWIEDAAGRLVAKL